MMPPRHAPTGLFATTCPARWGRGRRTFAARRRRRPGRSSSAPASIPSGSVACRVASARLVRSAMRRRATGFYYNPRRGLCSGGRATVVGGARPAPLTAARRLPPRGCRGPLPPRTIAQREARAMTETPTPSKRALLDALHASRDEVLSLIRRAGTRSSSRRDATSRAGTAARSSRTWPRSSGRTRA